jgi:ribose 5-phosphate isomerase B
MRIYLGSDHAGYAIKVHLLRHLPTLGHEAIDCGPPNYVDGDDYPPYCLRTGIRVVGDPGSLGIVIGGSGNGEQIAANKVKGVRAALAWNERTAQLAREHNNANVVSIGARMHSVEDATRFVEIFVATAFSEGERHKRRIQQLADYEGSGTVPESGTA